MSVPESDISAEVALPLTQAVKAIKHTLRRIAEDPSVGWYLGLGTETFELLTQAAATLSGGDVADVREFYRPRNAKNPATEKQEPEEETVDPYGYYRGPETVGEFVEEIQSLDSLKRIELFERVREAFCPRCGDYNGPIRVSPCGCGAGPLRHLKGATR